MRTLIFVGTEAEGLYGNGKVGHFYRFADPVFARNGVDVLKIRGERAFIESQKPKRALLTLVYNETALQNPERHAAMKAVEESARSEIPDLVLANAAKIGRIIGDKRAAMGFFIEAGIPTPRPADHTSTAPIFSNEVVGSGRPVKVYQPGDSIDPKRHNTQLIDTRHHFKGKDYYVCLRAMCVGPDLAAVYVRARDASEGDPSVHTRDIPQDPDLLNHFYASIVIPAQGQIVKLCRDVGAALGLGFYSHDLLPCAETGTIYLCETGFKFDDAALAARLEPIKNEVVFNDATTGVESLKMAHLLVRHLS